MYIEALAFCDYSQLHCKRRAAIAHYTLPYSHSNNWDRMNAVCLEECAVMESCIDEMAAVNNGVVDIKSVLLRVTATVFNRYFCDSPRYDYYNSAFSDYIDDFEKVFFEVNIGRLCDFAPWALFSAALPIWRARRQAKRIQTFVQDHIVVPREQQCLCDPNHITLFIDGLIPFLNKENKDGEMSFDHAMYTLLDILGGHSAVGSIATRVVLDVVRHPEVALKIQEEIAKVEAATPAQLSVYSMSNTERFHWARASIFETLRTTCSPIVPHRATRDTTLGGTKFQQFLCR